MTKKPTNDIFMSMAEKHFNKVLTRQIEEKQKEVEEKIVFKEPILPLNTPDKYYLAIEKIREKRDELVDITSEKFVQIGRPVNATKKILSLSDLHIPFENPRLIEAMITAHHDADILVLNGDIFEIYSISKWSKSRSILLRHEYEIAIEWMKMFTKIFDKVVLVSGNHEKRVQRYFNDNIDPQVSFMVNKDILRRLADGYDFNPDTGDFEKMHDWDNVYYQGGELSFYTIIGKALFIHPMDFSSVQMQTAIKHAEDLMLTEDFDALICGHTHKMGKLIWKNKLILEQGCCCVPMDYEKTGRARKTPQTYGAAVVYMDDEGNVDFNKTDNIMYGSGSPVKTSDPLELLEE